MIELEQGIRRLNDQYFRAELSAKSYHRAKELPLVGCLSAFIVAVLFSKPVIRDVLQFWTVIAVLSFGVGHFFLFSKRAKPNHETYISWDHAFIGFFTIYGLLWAAFAVIVFPTISEWQEISLLLILFAVAVVPLPALVYCFPIAVVYPVLIFTIAVLMFLFTHGHVDSHIAFAITLYLGAMTYIYKQAELARHLISNIDDTRRLSSSIVTIEKLEHDRYHDSITGLLNVSGLRERIRQLKQEDIGCFCIFALKLDEVDDLYASHSKSFADGIIQAAAERLLHKKAAHTLLAHQGFGEFIILTPNDLRPQLKEVAQNVLGVFEEPFVTNDDFLTLSVSLGSAVFPFDSSDENQVVNCALTAMREADKEYGSAFEPYQEAMSSSVIKRIGLRAQIPAAIRNNEFLLYLQPKVTIDTGRIHGAEALIRWKSPELGLISPADFIPVAESTGDIIPLGRWIIDEAFRLLQDPALPERFSIAINISVKQFADPELLDRLQYIADAMAGSARKLDLEITESVLVTEDHEIRTKLQKLSEMGFSIALDDFGTGYSSLSYLSRLQVDTLKLDKSFIDPIPLNERHSALVSSVITMSRALDMTLVAEGVTSYEQLAWLARNQCKMAQGYLFAKPLAFDEFIHWLKDKSHKGGTPW